MRIPSVKTIGRLKKLNGETITTDESKAIRRAMENKKGLIVANTILDGCGIETIGLPDGCFENCQTPEITIRYINMGDTYDTTVLKVNGQYRIGNWGDIVERFDR